MVSVVLIAFLAAARDEKMDPKLWLSYTNRADHDELLSFLMTRILMLSLLRRVQLKLEHF
jgi:hypothetical protein